MHNKRRIPFQKIIFSKNNELRELKNRCKGSNIFRKDIVIFLQTIL